MNSELYNARRGLLWAALSLAATELGPEDETVSPYYNGQKEMNEEHLEEAARLFVIALDPPDQRTIDTIRALADAAQRWPFGKGDYLWQAHQKYGFARWLREQADAIENADDV